MVPVGIGEGRKEDGRESETEYQCLIIVRSGLLREIIFRSMCHKMRIEQTFNFSSHMAILRERQGPSNEELTGQVRSQP